MIKPGNTYHYNNRTGTDSHFTVYRIDSDVASFIWTDGSHDSEPINTRFWTFAQQVSLSGSAAGSEAKPTQRGITKKNIELLMSMCWARGRNDGKSKRDFEHEVKESLYKEWKKQLANGNKI